LTERLGDMLAALRRGKVSWRQAADLAVAVRELLTVGADRRSPDERIGHGRHRL